MELVGLVVESGFVSDIYILGEGMRGKGDQRSELGFCKFFEEGGD